VSGQLHRRSDLASIALAYVAWLLTGVLGVGVAWIWRSTLLGLFLRLRLDKYAYAAYNNAVVLALVLGWLVLVIASESWCRQSAQKGHLGRLIVRLDGGLAFLILIGFALYQVGL
jgi:hypothetical protein